MKTFKSFCLPLFISSALFMLFAFIICIPLLIKDKPIKSVQNLYSAADYTFLSSKILLEIDNVPFVFCVTINSNTKNLTVLALSKSATKIGGEKIGEEGLYSSVKNLINFLANKRVHLTEKSLIKLVNELGGVDIKSSYQSKELLHLYGNALLNILNKENQSTEQMEYCANIIGSVIIKVFKNFSENIYYIISDSILTDVSYSDYYNNKAKLSGTVYNLIATAPQGKWINNKYYLF